MWSVKDESQVGEGRVRSEMLLLYSFVIKRINIKIQQEGMGLQGVMD